MVARREAHNAGPNPNTAEGRLLASMIEACTVLDLDVALADG
jgi:hypothetical protein